MFEMTHFNSTNGKFLDYELNIYAELKPNEIAFIKVEKTNETSQALL